jgi:hypothetical protein
VTGDEHPHAGDRPLRGAGGGVEEFGGDVDRRVGVHVPQGEGALDHLDVVTGGPALGPVRAGTRVRGVDGQSLDPHMPGPDLVPGEQQNLPRPPTEGTDIPTGGPSR